MLSLSTRPEQIGRGRGEIRDETLVVAVPLHSHHVAPDMPTTVAQTATLDPDLT
jgi:hypothetical protein